MPADGLTKILPRQKHEAWIKQLNLVDIRHQITNNQHRCNIRSVRNIRNIYNIRNICNIRNMLFYLSVSYSFDYTVKSGGVCNRLPVPCQSTVSPQDRHVGAPRQDQHYPHMSQICLEYISNMSRIWSKIESQTLEFGVYFRVYIPLAFHRFIIKSLMQFFILQQLTLSIVIYYIR